MADRRRFLFLFATYHIIPHSAELDWSSKDVDEVLLQTD